MNQLEPHPAKLRRACNIPACVLTSPSPHYPHCSSNKSTSPPQRFTEKVPAEFNQISLQDFLLPLQRTQHPATYCCLHDYRLPSRKRQQNGKIFRSEIPTQLLPVSFHFISFQLVPVIRQLSNVSVELPEGFSALQELLTVLMFRPE